MYFNMGCSWKYHNFSRLSRFCTRLLHDNWVERVCYLCGLHGLNGLQLPSRMHFYQIAVQKELVAIKFTYSYLYQVSLWITAWFLFTCKYKNMIIVWRQQSRKRSSYIQIKNSFDLCLWLSGSKLNWCKVTYALSDWDYVHYYLIEDTQHTSLYQLSIKLVH